MSPIVCYILGRFDILIYSLLAAAAAASATSAGDSLKTRIAQFLLQFKLKIVYFRHFFVTSQFYFSSSSHFCHTFSFSFVYFTSIRFV